MDLRLKNQRLTYTNTNKYVLYRNNLEYFI